ncbi:glycosyltransferase [Halonotius sp. GCM10025705]|uniref:glycosyltransferase n=1 Tax=Halonotius sp. GCM10025705 TaxID=3252678 RepID=UPI00361C7018
MTDISLFIPRMAGGGAEKIILKLSKSLNDRGYDVDLVLVDQSGAYIDEVPDDVHIVELDASRTLTTLPKLALYLRRTSPDSLLTTLNHSNLIAIWAKTLSRSVTRVLIRQANIPSVEAQNTCGLNITHILMKIFYSWSDQIIAISEYCREDLIENYGANPESTIKIYNPVDINEIDTLKKENLEFEIKSQYHIVAAGRLSPEKDFETLLRSFYFLSRSVDAELTILGEGEMEENLKKLSNKLEISGRVTFTGFVSNPYKFMRSADVFVLSSKSEGFGNVLIEAMACETPVVSTNCPGGPSEILQNGKYGKLVPVGHPKELYKAISSMLTMPTNGSALRSRAEEFDMNHIVDEYEEIIMNRC